MTTTDENNGGLPFKIATVELPPGVDTLRIEQLRDTPEGRQFLIAIGLRDADYVAKRKKHDNAKPSYRKSGQFVGWDGEGVTVDGSHRYVMLCNSFGHSLTDENGLSTFQALDFLLGVAEANPKSNHVMFGGSYDANMILSDLPYSKITELAWTGRTWLHNGDKAYLIKFRQRKFFHVVEYQRNGPRQKDTKLRSILIWDVIGFFQCSFVKALEAWFSDEVATIDFITDMKARRSDFGLDDQPSMKSYCLEECRLLVALMDKMRNVMRRVDMLPTRWDGAGAASATLLKKHGVQAYRGNHHQTPPEVWNATKYAYFGGRIEMVQYGYHKGPVYAHDINSAYPSAMVNLPCLAHGEWVHGWNYPHTRPSDFTLCRVEYDAGQIDRPFNPLPWRNENGCVFFPATTEGWYWWPEVKNLGYGFGDNPKCMILEWWGWRQTCDHRPFRFVPGIYAARQQYKAKGHHANIVLKLALNAIYGKLAQQVGGKGGNPPPFHQLAWAGYITSVTRAKMYATAMQNPASVIAFETDGVYTTEPLDVEQGTELGQWERKEHDGIIYVQSGVYWTGKRRNEIGDVDWSAKYRGLDPGSLMPEQVMVAWRQLQRYVTARSTRFHGLVTSSVSPEAFCDWRQWPTEERQVALFPQGKRVTHPGGGMPPHLALARTMATGGGSFSHPHKLRWETGDGAPAVDDEYYLSRMRLEEATEE